LSNAIVAQLIKLGWTVEKPPFDDYGRKNYATAVGLREAFVYLRDYRDTPDCIVLKGDYQSEGRNALSTTWATIDKGAGGDVISREVALFSANVDEAVSKTYAARLLTTGIKDGSDNFIDTQISYYRKHLGSGSDSDRNLISGLLSQFESEQRKRCLTAGLNPGQEEVMKARPVIGDQIQ